MHDNPSSRNENPDVHDDKMTQAAVLNLVLDEHPAQLTVAEISREIVGNNPDFAGRDAIDRAVRDLVGVGLLTRIDTAVAPTRALRYVRELEL
jgi:hypothetical protein